MDTELPFEFECFGVQDKKHKVQNEYVTCKETFDKMNYFGAIFASLALTRTGCGKPYGSSKWLMGDRETLLSVLVQLPFCACRLFTKPGYKN